MKPCKIIYRYPTIADLKIVWEYINTLSKEQTFILFQGEQITWEAEEKWLEGELKKIKESKSVQIFAFAGGKLIGVSGISMKDKAEKHLGVFSNNPIAKSLYEKMGFVEYGILPKGILHKGKFIDHIYMYRGV